MTTFIGSGCNLDNKSWIALVVIYHKIDCVFPPLLVVYTYIYIVIDLANSYEGWSQNLAPMEDSNLILLDGVYYI